MIGIFQNNSTNNNQTPIIQEYLPTPQISSVGSKDKSLYKQVDNFSWKTHNYNDVYNFTGNYTNDYFIQLFDVYFNSFGSDRNWLQMPDLKLELCRVNQKKQSGWGAGNTNNTQGLSQGSFSSSQKDFGTTQIVHSANLVPGNSVGTTITDTNYSGGSGTYMQTEWLESELQDNKNHNNPAFRVEIDYLNFIRSSKTGSYNNTNVFVCSANQGDFFYSRGSHSRTMPKSQTKQKYYTYNTILYFRLSAGVEGTLDANTGVYQKRIYSDLSIPIYFCPEVRTFYQTANDDLSPSDALIYHYKLKLGSK